MSENHDPGDEQELRIGFYNWCPHCGTQFQRHNGWCTPVLKPFEWLAFAAKPISDEKPYDEVLNCCGHTHCIVKDRELARKLAESLDYKLDRRRYDLMIKEAKERNAGV